MVETIKITDEDLKKYKEAQKLKSHKCTISGVVFKQNKYSLQRYINSGLSAKKYLYIADNEESFFGKETKNDK